MNMFNAMKFQLPGEEVPLLMQVPPGMEYQPEPEPTPAPVAQQPQRMPASSAGFQPSYQQQFDDAFKQSMGLRNEQLQALRQRLAETQGAKPSGIQALNLQPFAAFADTLTGYRTAQHVQPNQELDKHEARVNKLQGQVDQSSNAITDDQLGYLRLKAQEEAIRNREAAAERKASMKLSKDATDMRKEWLKNPITKMSQEVATAYEKVRAAGADPSPAGDLSLIFGYMKMLDPGSVVREGEFATAQNAAAVPDRVRNMYNRIMTGERLNPVQRQDFIQQASNVYGGQMEQQNRFNQSFYDLALRTGVSPQDVVLSDIFSKEGKSGSKGAGVKPGAMEDGYRFKGGNPEDPNSWEKVK